MPVLVLVLLGGARPPESGSELVWCVKMAGSKREPPRIQCEDCFRMGSKTKISQHGVCKCGLSFEKNGTENGASKFTERVQKTMAQANIHTVDLRLLEAQAKTRG